MVIHFIGSRSNVKEEITYYRKIVDIVKAEGHVLMQDWIDEAYSILEERANADLDEKSFDWSKIDADDAAAISRADIVIVEATRKSFFVGYRMAQAIQQKKPTLILYRDNSFPGATDLSSSANSIYAAEYTEKTLEPIVKKFIEDNTIETKDMRFNFFIDRPIYNYLRWAAFRTGKTKAEVLRELVQREIEKEN